MNGRLEKEKKLEEKTYTILYDLPSFVEEWYEYMEASSKTASSRRDFVYKIKKYLYSINEKIGNITTDDLTYKSVINYMKSIKTKENKTGEIVATSGSYQKTVWAALNNFFSFMAKRKYISYNIMDDIDVSKKNDIARINRNRKFFTIEDFNKIISATDTQTNNVIRLRDKAILLIFMSTGIRRRALAQINIEDIDFQKGILNVVDKEDAERDCYLMPNTVKTISDYLKCRKSNNNALFLSKRGNRISEEDIYYLVNKYSKIGLGYSISPHKLRAGFCTILYTQTKDIRLVQETVGHANINTTQRYAVVDINKNTKIDEVFNKLYA